MDNDIEMNLVGKARAEAQERQLVEAGIAFNEKTWFPFGTKLIEAGQDNYKASRLAFDERPGATVSLPDTRMTVDGKLYRRIEGSSKSPATDGRTYQTGPAIPVSRWALGQLAHRLNMPGGAGSYLAGSPAAKRAADVNMWAVDASYLVDRKKDGVVVKTERLPIEAVFRTRLEGASNGTPAKRGIYAVVSDRYNCCDFPMAIEAFLGACPPGAKGEFTYDGTKWRFRALFHAPTAASEVVVGDTFQFSMWMEGADDGSAGFLFGLDALRVRCVNLTTIYTRRIEGTLRHNMKELSTRISSTVSSVMERLSLFAPAWAKAREEQIFAEGVFDARHVFTQLVRDEYVHVAGYSETEMVERLVNAWHMEPGYSKADIINAVTRMAHTEGWSSAWDTCLLEEQAGSLLYQHVVIAPPESDTLGLVQPEMA